MPQVTAFAQFDNNDRKRPPLASTAAVIDALGGSTAAARLTGRGQAAACNWRTRAQFPPNTYLAMTQALLAKGLYAPA